MSAPFALPLWVNYVPERDYDEMKVEGIYDYKGMRIVETDSGYYPPNVEQAEYLVAATNAWNNPAALRARIAELEKQQ